VEKVVFQGARRGHRPNLRVDLNGAAHALQRLFYPFAPALSVVLCFKWQVWRRDTFHLLLAGKKIRGARGLVVMTRFVFSALFRVSCAEKIMVRQQILNSCVRRLCYQQGRFRQY
jgi:hypothetical protein